MHVFSRAECREPPKDTVGRCSGTYSSSVDSPPVGMTRSVRPTLSASPQTPVTHKCSHTWGSVFSTTASLMDIPNVTTSFPGFASHPGLSIGTGRKFNPMDGAPCSCLPPSAAPLPPQCSRAQLPGPFIYPFFPLLRASCPPLTLQPPMPNQKLLCAPHLGLPHPCPVPPATASPGPGHMSGMNQCHTTHRACHLPMCLCPLFLSSACTHRSSPL